MKQRELIKKLEVVGFRFDRHGGNHDIYKRGSDEEKIPRHKEINENSQEGLSGNGNYKGISIFMRRRRLKL